MIRNGKLSTFAGAPLSFSQSNLETRKHKVDVEDCDGEEEHKPTAQCCVLKSTSFQMSFGHFLADLSKHSCLFLPHSPLI